MNEWDLIVYDRDGQLALIAEVKPIKGADSEWAQQFRYNLFHSRSAPYAPYFLVALLDQFYLWADRLSGSTPDAAPDYVIDARPILEPYLERTGLSASQLSQPSLEIIVIDWLGGLMYKRATELTESEQWLIESGLHSAIAGGRFAQQIFA